MTLHRLRCVVFCLVVTTLGRNTLSKQVDQLKSVIASLSRQVMMQQLSIEEKVRADGGSGLKQVRANKGGPETYHTSSHTGDSIAAIHDHSNYRNTIGQGEGQFVLNGVEFRTRHNDYLLRMPSTKSPAYNLVEDIPFPPVPPEVLLKPTVQAQISEMQEWFKAWKGQDFSARDYRPYFRPVLCYLEGAWTTKTDKIEEPFFSERHSLGAETWQDLQDKVRFAAYTGRKDVLENIAYLPSSIFRITEEGIPEYAQWNYRILCHPITGDLRTSYLRVVDDLSARLPRGKTLEQYTITRSARFNVDAPQDRKFTSWTLLDELMSQVPGKDNYVANITDTSFTSTVLDPQAKNRSLLNVGFYHRRYKVEKTDAMGLVYNLRGFSDPNIFMAETTQSRISSLSLKECRKRKCIQSVKRMSYAIPLEMIYLTPLSNWNPYRLEHVPLQDSDVVSEKGQRSGACVQDEAYNGTNDRMYYRTPAEFFSGREVGTSLADTVKGSVCVLDPEENTRKVTAAGIRIFLPKIPGVGVLRTRYPIMPIHGESSGVWKELNALKNIVKSLVSHEKYLLQKLPRSLEANELPSKPTENKSVSKQPSTSENSKSVSEIKEKQTDQSADECPFLALTLSTTTEMPPGEHSHAIEFTREESDHLKSRQVIPALTSQDNGHSHQITINYHDNRYKMTSCDDTDLPCWDGRPTCLSFDTDGICPQDQSPTSGPFHKLYSAVNCNKTSRAHNRDIQLHLP